MMFDLKKYQPQALGVLRIVVALLYGEHGTQKLLHFPAMGFPGGRPSAAGHAANAAAAGGPPGGGPDGGMGTLFLVAGIIETFGGLAILIGLFTRPIAFLLAGELAVIYWWMHVPRGGFFPLGNGGESAVMWCFTMLYLVVAGPGAWAVDNVAGKRRRATMP
jgi:putative oxidoreductase